MIELERIASAIEGLAKSAGLEFTRAEQDAPRLKLPFLSYKITAAPWPERATERVHTQAHATDTELVIRHAERDAVAMVSCNLYGDHAGDLWRHAGTMLEWMESDPGRELFREHGLVVLLRSDPADRSTYLETGWEARIGFDLEIHGCLRRSAELPAVDLAATVAAARIESGAQS